MEVPTKLQKTAFTFNREQTAQLIAIYEKHHVLYVVSHEQYKNKSKRLIALKKVVAEFRKHYPDIDVSVDDFRKKINGLRTQFFAELGKVKKCYSTGAEAEDVYIPTLWCYDQLQFLNEGAPVHTGESNLSVALMNDNTQVEDQEEHELLFEGEIDELNSGSVGLRNSCSSRSSDADITGSSEATLVTPKRRKISVAMSKDTESKKIMELMEKATSVLSAGEPTREPTEIQAFAMTVAAELAQIKCTSRCRKVRREITMLIHEALEAEEDLN